MSQWSNWTVLYLLPFLNIIFQTHYFKSQVLRANSKLLKSAKDFKANTKFLRRRQKICKQMQSFLEVRKRFANVCQRTPKYCEWIQSILRERKRFADEQHLLGKCKRFAREHNVCWENANAKIASVLKDNANICRQTQIFWYKKMCLKQSFLGWRKHIQI